MSSVSISTIKQMKKDSKQITVLTAYDFYTAKILDEVGIDIILVGDSLGMVFQGKKNTLEVTMKDIAYHTKVVSGALKKAFLIADMPFMSSQISVEKTLQNAAKLIQKGGANAVKIEGCSSLDTISKIVSSGIPVMGHLGLTPQSINQIGSYKIQGKTKESYLQIVEDAKKLEEAGVFAIVLEMVPAALAQEITSILNIPVIGCGSGPFCDGQVLVTNDILGLYPSSPKFSKQYVNLTELIRQAGENYIKDVRAGIFPAKE